MTRTRSTYLTLIAVLLSPIVAHADLVEIDFEFDSSGNPVASAGLLTLGLNGDGTISAFVESLVGDVIGVGIDAGFGSETAFEYDFSPITPSNLGGWGSGQGTHNLGFACCASGISSSVSWTIGSIGQFSSVFDILGGNGSSFDAILVTNGVFYGNAELVSVPEPGTLALLGIGLAGMGLTRRRKRA